jgi:hypothetical protein
MSSQDPWLPWNLDRADLPAGQGYSNLGYTDEPDPFRGEVYGIDRAMPWMIDEPCAGQSSADSYDGFPPLMAPFDEFAHQVSTGLTFDSDSPNLHPRPYTRTFRRFPGVAHSVPSIETEHSNEDEPRYLCQECNKLFKNLQELDQHTKRVPHKAWICAELFCGKAYVRRDTFLRHRATHKDKSHACPTCALHNKQKTFKRKDHLKEHMRNCHAKDIEPTSVENVRYA